MQPSNYIKDTNPFNLAGPPTWFLAQLWDFDPSLVIIPSRQGFCYRLTQRRPLKLAENIVNESLFRESDTQMLSSYGLVPVTTILATANWSNPLLFHELASRAPWRMGGGDAVADRMDRTDLDDRLSKHLKTDEHLTSLSKDGWQLYRNKIGLGRSWSTSKQAPTYLKPTGQVAHRKFFGNF